jgi:hypothetical protein
MMRPSFLIVFVLAVLAAAIASTRSSTRAADPNPKSAAKGTVGVEDAYRAWHKGMTSGKEEDKEKALRDILPRKKDIEHLFPKQAEKL